MRYQKYKDVILGGCIIAIAIIYLIVGAGIVSKVKTTVNIDARFIPRILGILMLIIGSLLSLQGMRNARHFDESKAEKKADPAPVLITFALIIAYVALLKPLGFILASVLYLFAQMMVLAPKDKRKPLVFAIVSVVFALFIYYVFRNLLDLMLPQGILPL